MRVEASACGHWALVMYSIMTVAATWATRATGRDVWAMDGRPRSVGLFRIGLSCELGAQEGVRDARGMGVNRGYTMGYT